MQPLINFIHGDVESWADVAADDSRNVSIHELAPRIRMGREIWLVQAFQLLRQRGHRVRLSDRFDPAAINVAHSDDIRPHPDLWKNFIVSVRADRDPVFLSHLEIVQNRHSIWSDHDHYIPHWPQPGLIPRNPARGHKVENIFYMGKADNLEDSFKSQEFERALRQQGMKLCIQENEWWDYSEADVVLAVRGGSRFYLAIKPATKLVNAWLAKCPAILSPEPGYSELRKSNDDYFEASDPDEVLAALEKLRKAPELMENMLENGTRRGREFTADAVADRWEEFLSEIATNEFLRWRQSGSEGRRKRHYRKGLIKRRIWGHWAVGSHKAPWKEALGMVRRRLLLPLSARAS